MAFLDLAFQFGKLLFQVGQHLVLQVLDFPCPVLHLNHQAPHMTELRYINIQCGLGRNILFSDKILQKILCLAHDAAEQIGKPTAVTDRLADFFVDL